MSANIAVYNEESMQYKKRMDPEFLNTDGEHQHDDSVKSVSIVEEGNLDMELLHEWIGDILQNKGADIYRMKGAVSYTHLTLPTIYSV